MVMIRANDKAKKIAEKVMKNKGIKISKGTKVKSTKLDTPYLQH